MSVIGYNPVTPGGSITFNSAGSAQARLLKTGSYTATSGDQAVKFYVYVAGGSGGDSVLNYAICSTSNISVPNGSTAVHTGTITITAAMKASPGWYSTDLSFTLTPGTVYIAQVAGTTVTGIAIGADTLSTSSTFRAGTSLETPWSSTTSWGSSGNLAVYFDVATQPTFTAEPVVDTTGITTATIEYTSDSTGTGAVVATAHDAAQPSDATFDAVAEAITADTPVSKNLTSLTAGTRYKVWVQIKSSAGARTTSSVGMLTSNTGSTSRMVLTSYNTSALNRITAVSNLTAGEIVEVGTVSGSGSVDITVDGTVLVDEGVTAFEVYRGTVAGGWDAPQTQTVPSIADSVGMRTVSFLASPDLSTWSQTITGSGTITLSGTGNVRATIVNDGARTFLYKNASVTAGRWYALTADIVSAAANFDTDSYGDAHFLIFNGVAGGDQFYPITSASDGTRRGILFQALSTGTETFRVGVGAAGNREAGTLVIENLQINDYGTTQPTLIDKFYDVRGASAYPLKVYTKLDAASTYSSGVVTPVTPTVERTDISTESLILCIGDSYGLNDRYPPQIKRAFKTAGRRCDFYNAHVGGETLAQIRDRLEAALTGSSYPSAVAPLWSVPETLVLEGGGNSILDDIADTTILSQLDECLTIARNNGVTRIVLVNIPPFANYASYTAPRDAEAVSYNALLGSVYGRCRVYDLRSAVAGDVNTDALSNRANGDTWDYDSGDGLHPTAAASVKIGSGLSSLLVAQVSVTANARSWNLPVWWDGNRYSETSDAPSVQPPTSFTATPSSSTMNLAWTNNATGAYQTLIERSPNGSTGWATVATKSAGVASHSDTSLISGTYYYRISATISGAASSYATANAQIIDQLSTNTFEGFSDGATVTGTSGSMTWGSAVSAAASTTQAYAGTKSLRFRYTAGAHWSEQQFALGAHYSALTFKYRLFVPVNYEHRTSGSGYEGPNNKFFRLWGDPGYGSAEKVGASFYPGSSTANSDLYCEWDGTGSGMGQKTPQMANFITAADYGNWLEIVLYIKHESSAGANDGIFAVYRNGVELRNASMNNYNSTAGNAHGFKYGYLMGYANSAYTNQTDFFIDNFEIYSGDAR